MMKIFRKLAVAAASALVSLSASAALISVQGVSWDPNSTSPTDFQASSNFSQWYQSGSAFAPLSALSFANPAGLIGSYVTGAGKFNTVNGVNQVGGDPNPETTPAIFAPGRELTYIYGGIKIIGANVIDLDPGPGVSGIVLFTFDLSSSYFNVYSDSARDYPESSGVLADQLKAGNTDLGIPFLTGKFDELSTGASPLTAAGTLSGTANGLISVTGGAAFNYFDTNGEPSASTPGVFADLTFTGSSQIAVGSKISTVGTGEFQGDTRLPEPSALALVGLALLSSGFAAARKRSGASKK